MARGWVLLIRLAVTRWMWISKRPQEQWRWRHECMAGERSYGAAAAARGGGGAGAGGAQKSAVRR